MRSVDVLMLQDARGAVQQQPGATRVWSRAASTGARVGWNSEGGSAILVARNMADRPAGIRPTGVALGLG